MYVLSWPCYAEGNKFVSQTGEFSVLPKPGKITAFCTALSRDVICYISPPKEEQEQILVPGVQTYTKRLRSNRIHRVCGIHT